MNHASVSAAVTPTGRNVSPAFTARALLTRANPAVAPCPGTHVGRSIHGPTFCFAKYSASAWITFAVEPDASPVLSGGAPGPHKLQGIGAGFVPAVLNTKLYDEVIRVKEADSGPVSKQVNQLDGIPIGISSGAAVWSALQLAQRPENKGKRIVVIIASASERYLSSWLFADINVESDSIDDLIGAAKA